MGGFGSGNHDRRSSKATVEACLTLDIRLLQRKGWLRAGVDDRLTWSQNGREVAAIGWLTVGDGEAVGSVELDYTRDGNTDHAEDIRYRVEVTYTPCNYGGRRPWFLCPGVINGVVCGRRAALLYLRGRYFLCRHCHDLAYDSQRDGLDDRAIRRARKIRRRLGGEFGMGRPFPTKPPTMHWRTYHRLRAKSFAAEQVHNDIFIGQGTKLIERFDKTLKR